MADPIQGKNYIVVSGDTMSSISARAYGDPAKWLTIWNANMLRVKDPDPDVIFPGEILFIPPDPLREQLAGQINPASEKNPDDFTLIIENIEVPVENANLIRTMDTLADMWTATIAWNPGLDPVLDELLKPFKYPKARVYLGTELMNTGHIYGIGSSFSDGKRFKTLTGYSKAIDAVDTTMKPPFEISNVTLTQRLEELLKNFGVNVIYELEQDGQFKKITAEPTETMFSHIAKLVSQRSALISSTPEGDVRVYTANVDGQTVGTLEEELQGVLTWAGNWDGRERYFAYKAIAQNPLGSSFAVSKDAGVPKSRFLTFSAPDTIAGSIQDAADWKRSKQYADALTQKLPLSGWYNPQGDLWTENTKVTVKSETLHIPDGYTYLIKSVEYIFGIANESMLSLVPPQVYSGEEIVEPW